MRDFVLEKSIKNIEVYKSLKEKDIFYNIKLYFRNKIIALRKVKKYKIIKVTNKSVLLSVIINRKLYLLIIKCGSYQKGFNLFELPLNVNSSRNEILFFFKIHKKALKKLQLSKIKNSPLDNHIIFLSS